MSSEENARQTNISSTLIKMGLVILALSFCVFIFIYYPIISKEIMYLISKPDTNKQVTLNTQSDQKEKVIVAADKEFSIVIPKIGANSKVIKDVDPNNSAEYQVKLTQGVAHAKGTYLPGETGNSFYFAHSSDNFINANRYNSVFYLLDKLVNGDLFYLIYKSQIYRYEVTETRIVNADEVSYLKGDQTKKSAVLMTCWPAATTLKRLVVVGELIQ